MNKIANFEQHFVDSVVQEIQQLAGEDYITDAIEKLLDMIRDVVRDKTEKQKLQSDAVKLAARNSRLQKARRNKFPEPEPADTIISDLLRLTNQAAERARIPIELTKGAAGESLQAAIKSAVAEPSVYDPEYFRRMLIRASHQSGNQDSHVVARMRDIETHYRRGGFKLGPVSLELYDGEITGVVGMNASGKTTMLRILLGELKADSGEVSYPALARAHRDPRHIKSDFGYVPQLPDRWSGRLKNNLNFTAAAYGLTGPENTELVDWYLHRYALKDYENATWDEISGGFKIRFELVRALLTRPKLLVLDEPLAYLDIVTQQIFLHDLRSIASSIERPIPIMVTSQHLHEIEGIADRMVILDGGRCIFSGPLDELPDPGVSVFEVEIEARKGDILEKLRPVGLTDIEKTALGWILFFKRKDDDGAIQRGLLENFAGGTKYFRDITRSTRVLFRNHRDDFDAQDSKQGPSRRDDGPYRSRPRATVEI